MSSKLVSNTELFKQLMREVANQTGFKVAFEHGNWKIMFYNDSSTFEMLNYDIGLNTSQASLKAKDKSLCYTYLSKGNIPAVEHVLVPHPRAKKINPSRIKDTLDFVKLYHPYPLVVKPNAGGGGKDIQFVTNDSELMTALMGLFEKNLEATISPFYDYTTEYRCTVLDGEVIMWYGKTEGANLQHNLSKGAKVVEVPNEIKQQLYLMAIRTTKALGLRFANVDIINPQQGLRVLEVNGTVAQKRVAFHSDAFWNQSVDVYVKAIQALQNSLLQHS